MAVDINVNGERKRNLIFLQSDTSKIRVVRIMNPAKLYHMMDLPVMMVYHGMTIVAHPFFMRMQRLGILARYK